MANKSAPAKKKPTTDGNKEPAITVIKKATCKSLQGTATLTYCLGLDNTSSLHWKIHANSGNGMFSQVWVPFAAIQKALEEWSRDHPIVSMALLRLFAGKSVNTPSFLLACLANEGIVEPVPDKKRHYQLADAKPFLAEVEKLKADHSTSGKAKPRAKAKAAARMPKAKAKATTGK